METDRKLLALAAKAAGRTYEEWAGGLWDPRRDSGQAFELGVLLDITVGENGQRMVAEYVDGGRIIDDIAEPFTHDDMADQLRAARLALTRAAASIGRAMP